MSDELRPQQSFYEKYEAAIWGFSSIGVIIAAWEAAWQAKMISPLFFIHASSTVTYKSRIIRKVS